MKTYDFVVECPECHSEKDIKVNSWVVEDIDRDAMIICRQCGRTYTVRITLGEDLEVTAHVLSKDEPTNMGA